MQEPVRYRDGDDHAAKRLMSAMREEQPPDGALERAVVAFGIAGATVATASAAGGATAASSTFFKSLTWLGIKWLSVGALLGGVAATGVTLLKPAPQQPARAREPAVLMASAIAPADLPRKIESPDSTEATEEAPKRPAVRASAPLPIPADPPGPSVGGFAPPVEDMLAREIDLLDQARGALRRGSPDQALSTLDRFAREFPRGRLSAQAFVVRLEALIRAGRKDEARALAERHLAANPNSPHAAQIRKLTGIAGQ